MKTANLHYSSAQFIFGLVTSVLLTIAFVTASNAQYREQPPVAPLPQPKPNAAPPPQPERTVVTPPSQPKSSVAPYQSRSYDETVAEARKLLAQKKAPDAVTQSEAAIRLDDKRWEAYVTAASGYSAQKLYDDAVGMLQMALIRAPQDKKQLVRDAIADARKSAGGATSASSTTTTQSAPTSSGPTQTEIVLWKSIENSTRMEDFKAYLEKYPDGTFATLASARVEKMKADEDAKEAAAKNAREEQERQAAKNKYAISVFAFGETGLLQIEPDQAIFRSNSHYVIFAKSDITSIEIDRFSLTFHLANKKNRGFGVDVPVQAMDSIRERWGFVPVKDGNGNKFVPAD